MTPKGQAVADDFPGSGRSELTWTPRISRSCTDCRWSTGSGWRPGWRGPEQLAGTGGADNRSWLATTNPDGSPHLTGLGPLWVSGLFYFTTGETTRKARNLARDPRCTLGVSTEEFDLAVDGDAALVDDPDVVAEMAGRWASGGWPASVDATGVGADRRLQRAVRGAAAVAGLPAHAPAGNGGARRRTRRRHPVAVLTDHACLPRHIVSTRAWARRIW